MYVSTEETRTRLGIVIVIVKNTYILEIDNDYYETQFTVQLQNGSVIPFQTRKRDQDGQNIEQTDFCPCATESEKPSHPLRSQDLVSASAQYVHNA